MDLSRRGNLNFTPTSEGWIYDENAIMTLLKQYLGGSRNKTESDYDA